MLEFIVPHLAIHCHLERGTPCCHSPFPCLSIYPVVTVHLFLYTLLLLCSSPYLCTPCCYCALPISLYTLLLLCTSPYLCTPCCYCALPPISVHPVVTVHFPLSLYTLLLLCTSPYFCTSCCYSTLLSTSCYLKLQCHLPCTLPKLAPSDTPACTSLSLFQSTKLTQLYNSAQYYFLVSTFPQHETLSQLTFQLWTSLLAHSSTILKYDVHLFTCNRKNSADSSAVVFVS